jgi:hypothetical protein
LTDVVTINLSLGPSFLGSVVMLLSLRSEFEALRR